MSHRVISIDPSKRRKKQYDAIKDQQTEAIMEAFALLKQQGFNVGDKMNEALSMRETIKTRNPKTRKNDII